MNRLMPSSSAPMVEWAIGYAERGIPVFPVARNAKVPITENGVKEATTDRKTIFGWWGTFPQANIGAACGFLFDALDSDFGGEETIDDFGGVPDCPRVLTPSGGRHFYLLPAKGKLNAVRALEGLDYKTLGGYVLLPPSYITVLPDEAAPVGSPKRRGYWGHYEWERPLGSVELPWCGWVQGALKERTGGGPTGRIERIDDVGWGFDPHDEAGRGPRVRNGERNDTLFKIACRYRDRGLDAAGILRKLLCVNFVRCEIPLSLDEVKTIAESSTRYMTAKEKRLAHAG